ncbi:MAG: hypothetical protein MSS60_00100 [Clostridiales bacterium]|nr:hypothetical protein [Clostridiales bacterium]
MAGRIKGITVEIGGDTKGLSDSLKGVNKEIKSTQSQLKDVERLLKLDPTNTNLLQQRQKLLAKSVEETKDKLKTLKDASEQAAKTSDKYDDWKKAYDPIRKEIESTNATLDKLKKKQLEMQDLGKVDTDAYKQLTAEIESTTKKVTELRKQGKAVSDEFGNPISPERWDSLQREIIDTEQQLKSLEKAASSSNAVLSKVSAVADKVADSAGKIANKTKALSGAATGIIGAGIGSAVSAGLSADDTNTLSKQSGFSTDLIQMWQYASDRIDVSVNDIVKSAQKMKKNMVSTGSDVTEAWKRLGVSVTDSNGNLRDTSVVFDEVVRALGGIENETERDTLAMTLFGKSADSLAGLLDDGGASFQQFAKEAKDAGLILDQDALNKANEFNDAIDKIKAQSAGTFAEIGTEIAGMLLPYMDDLGDAISKALEWFRNLDEGQIKLLGTILLVIAGISPVFGIISSIASGVSSVSSAINSTMDILPRLQQAFSTVFSFIAANPIVLLIAAIVALVSLIVAKGDEIQALLQKVDDFLQGVFATDWTTIFDSVLGNALNTFFANLKNIWDSILQVLNGVIDVIRGVFTGNWERAWNGVKEIFGGIFSGLYALAVAPLNGIIGFINTIIDGINWVISGLNSIPGVNFDTMGKIPFLANGGTVLSGSAIVGEAGPELLTVSGGRAVVQPLTSNTGRIEGQLGNIAGLLGQYAGAEQPIVVQLMLDGDVIGRTAVNYSKRRSRSIGE